MSSLMFAEAGNSKTFVRSRIHKKSIRTGTVLRRVYKQVTLHVFVQLILYTIYTF